MAGGCSAEKDSIGYLFSRANDGANNSTLAGVMATAASKNKQCVYMAPPELDPKGQQVGGANEGNRIEAIGGLILCCNGPELGLTHQPHPRVSEQG